jgi:YD repeat-containing protein
MIMAVRDGRPDRTDENDRSETYEYNDREQLVKASGRYGEIRWRWDAAARLLERTSSTVAVMNLGSLTYPMNVTDAQPHGARRAGRHTLEYDADGNVRSFDGRPFRWDARNYNVELSDERGRTEESWFDQSGMRRIRHARGGGESDETTIFLSPAEELRNGQLVRYVLIGDEAVWFADRGNPPETAAPRMACNAKTMAPEGLIWGVVRAARAAAVSTANQASDSAKRGGGASSRRASWRAILVRARGPWTRAKGRSCCAGSWVRRSRSRRAMERVSERDVRFPGGVLRSGPENARQRRFSGSQPQATRDFAFIGPRVLMLDIGIWLSPASVWLGGGDESPYSYGDGDFVSRVDSSGHSWGDAFLHYTERALTAVGNGIERVTQATEVVASLGVPVVSQAAGAYVATARGAQAATGVGFNGDTLTRAQRADAAVSALGGVASAAGAGASRSSSQRGRWGDECRGSRVARRSRRCGAWSPTGCGRCEGIARRWWRQSSRERRASESGPIKGDPRGMRLLRRHRHCRHAGRSSRDRDDSGW